jgi:hypothetical protein
MHPDVVKYLEETGDSTAATLAVTMLQIEESINDVGWDEYPTLWLIYRDLPPTDVAEQLTQLGLDAVKYNVQLFPLPPLASRYGGKSLAQALNLVAETMLGRHNDLPTGEEKVNPQQMMLSMVMPNGDLTWDRAAWVLSTEGYGIELNKGENPDDLHGSFRDRPDARELRGVVAVDRAGIEYRITRFRDTDKVEIEIVPARASATNAGRLYEALRALMDATP